MTKQEIKALWQYAKYLELQEKGSKLYKQVKERLTEELKGKAK